MIKLIILIISIFISGCSSSQNPKIFNVLPNFCYDGECYIIDMQSNMLLFNTNMPEGDYKIQSVTKMILLGDEKIEKDVMHMKIINDIVNFEIEDLLVQYNQRKQKIVQIIDKSGTLTPKQTSFLKKMFEKSFNLYLPPYASSGDTSKIKFDFNLGAAKIKINADIYIHGKTYYNKKKLPLVEIKGHGVMKNNGFSTPAVYSGYFIKDTELNINAKSVMDLTLKNEDVSQTIRIITKDKVIQ